MEQMDAIAYYKFGSTNNLRLISTDKPVPKADEVLIDVKASSVNSWDWDMLRGRPYAFRFLFGYFKPRHNIMGSDFAGVVDAVGSAVTGFQPGDRVFGDNSRNGFKTFAEYVAVKQEHCSMMPDSMSFTDAAAIPQAGVLALQGLELGNISSGQKVLINGAGGGVGSFAIQLAKMHGANVTAVDKTSKFDFMANLGADHVIDYQVANYTEGGNQYDLVLDNIALYKRADYKRVIKPEGKFIMVGGNPETILGVMLFGGQRMKALPYMVSSADQSRLANMVMEGSLKVKVDRIFPFEETAEAIQYLGDGKQFGKVVIKQ